jgi:hypothetical protein
MENWQEIKEAPGYLLSDQGRVRGKRGTILKPSVTGNGYAKMCLCIDGVIKAFSLHQLVLKTFGPEQPPNTTCDHINRIRTDNRIENLRWATKEEQTANSKCVKGSQNAFHKLVEEDIVKIRKLLGEGIPQRQIAARFDISQPTIAKINNNIIWTHVK